MTCDHGPGCDLHACFEEQHRVDHPQPVDDCLACKLDTLIVHQSVPGQKAGGPPPAGNRNSWERGIATDHRGVPFLDGQGEVIGVKQYADGRSRFEAERRRLASDPDPFPAKAVP